MVRDIAGWLLDDAPQLMGMILTRRGSRVAANAVDDFFNSDPELRKHLVAILADLIEDVD